MATDVTLVTMQSMIDQARAEANMELDSFVSNDELMQRGRREIRELYDLLIDGGETYFMTELGSQTLDANRKLYLPDDFYKLLGVDWFLGTRWVPLDPIPFINRNVFQYAFGCPTGYQLRGERGMPVGKQVSYLQIIPQDSAPQSTYRVFYAPKPLVPVNFADVIDGIQGYERFVITAMAAYMLTKKNILEVAGVFLQEREAIRARILEMAAKRSLGQPNHVTVKTPWNRGVWPFPIVPRN